MRKKPYTSRGIKRVPCCRCGAPGYAQWHGACADKNQIRVLCKVCDIDLNKLTLRFIFEFAEGNEYFAMEKRLREYARKVRG